VPRWALTIPRRFNGPLHSGQGGYSAGLVAGFIAGQAEVSLRRPVPLERELQIARDDDGRVRLLDGDDVIAEGQQVPVLDVDVPEPVSVADARLATARYRGSREGLFSRCFVCGLAREDSFEIFAGEVPGRQVTASPWLPPDWAAGDDGAVRPEFVWAALDCPATFAPLLAGAADVAFLARFSVRIDAPVVAGAEHVVIGWPIEIHGRKQHAGSAIFSADGAVLAVAHALLIAPRDPSR
jgi:hypothetical protein